MSLFKGHSDKNMITGEWEFMPYCEVCDVDPRNACMKCEGEGEIANQRKLIKTGQIEWIECPMCHGAGSFEDEDLWDRFSSLHTGCL